MSIKTRLQAVKLVGKTVPPAKPYDSATLEKLVELVKRLRTESKKVMPSKWWVDITAEHFTDEDSYRSALKDRGITEQEVKDEMLWQRTLLRFIEVLEPRISS